MPKIKNKRYRALVTSKKDIEGNEGWIGFQPMSLEEFKQGLETISFSSQTKTLQGKALAILLFYTGLRPVELLKIKGGTIQKTGQNITIPITSSKRGKAGIVLLSLTQMPLLQTVWTLASKTPQGMHLFYHFLNENAENKVSWLKKDNKTGEKQPTSKVYFRNQNLHYFINKHFSVPPYFFRHNRFSQASMKGATMKQLMEMKLAQREESVLPYLKWSEKGKKTLVKYYKT